MTNDAGPEDPAEPDDGAGVAEVDDLLARAARTRPIPDHAAAARISAAALTAAAAMLDESQAMAAEASPRRNRTAAGGVEPSRRQRGQAFVDITGAQMAAWRDGHAAPAVAAAIERAIRLGDPRVLELQAALDEADRLLATADRPTPSAASARRLRVTAQAAAREHLIATAASAASPGVSGSQVAPATAGAGGVRERVAAWLASGTALRVAGGLATIAAVAVIGTQVVPQFTPVAQEASDLAAGSGPEAVEEFGSPDAATDAAQDPVAAQEFEAEDLVALGSRVVDPAALLAQVEEAPIVGLVRELPVARLDLPSSSLTARGSIPLPAATPAPGESGGDDDLAFSPALALTGSERRTVRGCLDASDVNLQRVQRVGLVRDEAGATSHVVVRLARRLVVVGVADCG